MPAPLLLGQPVGVDARQGLDQGGLAVVDVPGRADQEALHGRRLSPNARRAAGDSLRPVQSAHRRRPEGRHEERRQAPGRDAAAPSRGAEEREDPGPARPDRRGGRGRAAPRGQAAQGLDRAVRARRAAGSGRRRDTRSSRSSRATCRRACRTRRSKPALRDVDRARRASPSAKDVGLAMKELMARHRGRVDGKQAQEIARRLLP